MNEKNKRKHNKSIEFDFNLSSILIKIIIICISIALVIGVKVVTTVIQPERGMKLATSEEGLSTVLWVDSTENDSDGNPRQVPVPQGYTASEIETETTVSGGFVIYEGEIDWTKIIISNETQTTTELTPEEQTKVNIFELQSTVNQWVWVPIDDISEIYGVDSKGKLWGKLYNFPTSTTEARSPLNWEEAEGIMSIKSLTANQEPAVMPNLNTFDTDFNMESYLDGTTRYELLAKEMEQNFYFMLKSINEYGGFYIGRYETGGLNVSGPAVVKKMNTNVGWVSWYTMYEKCIDLRGENDNVKTSMIWGSLWDATLEWFVHSSATNSSGTLIDYTLIGNDSRSWGNYGSSEFDYITADGDLNTTATKESGASTIIPTGSANYTKVNNIYDMAGNVADYTLEWKNANAKSYRGGGVISGGKTVSNRSSYYEPNSAIHFIGCRAILLIK